MKFLALLLSIRSAFGLPILQFKAIDHVATRIEAISDTGHY